MVCRERLIGTNSRQCLSGRASNRASFTMAVGVFSGHATAHALVVVPLQARPRCLDGAGSVPRLPLAKARIDAGHCRALLREGRDPLAERKPQRASLRLAEARNVTFADCRAISVPFAVRTDAIDLPICPDCGGRLRVITYVTRPDVIERISTAVARHVARQQAPPEFSAIGRRSAKSGRRRANNAAGCTRP